MGEKLNKSLLVTVEILSVLITIVLLIYLFGDAAYIIVPFIVVIGLVIYLIYDINKKKTRMKKIPEWDDFVRKHDGKGAKKAYQRDTRDRHSREGRQMHKEARGRNKHR
ncbi:MAG: DUF3784 domain-containing protein [Candidatus Thermoplasmatota archaeon]|nr:hypothetical protein [Euryarchaeota archaeon]MBU4071444.1 DUF3784 domain-containing protein [Candidatus Thermoplasmatota archaeon]MBU4144396.1 DUF3784 domain-containing protein [Candidatus Thermoplasmatota archaeon]MBU4591567.1 DUF3784 domain-containing protein [Candidatus Thermoplasmatota archaeon]